MLYMVHKPFPPTFSAAGSCKEKDQLTPRRKMETVSEQVQGVAQQQGVYTIV